MLFVWRSLRVVVSWALLLAYMGVLGYLLSREVATLKGFSDKVAHGIAFGVLGVLVYGAWGSVGRSAGERGAVSLLGASLYGLVGELMQSRIPGRHADVTDFFADVMGALLGTGVALLGTGIWRRGHLMRKGLWVVMAWGMASWGLSSRAASGTHLVGATLFVGGVGLKFAGTLTQGNAQRLYDDYLTTALQSELTQLRHNYRSKRRTGTTLSNAGNALLVAGALLSALHALRPSEPHTPLSLSPEVRDKAFLLALRRRL